MSADCGRRLALELLDVPVGLSCADPAHLERLELCYGRSLRDSVAADAIVACIERRDTARPDAWRVRVSDREPVEADDWVSAIRTLNHELMHGVMLRNRSLYYVHASVVRHRGLGLLLPGLSQAGKSTLARAFVAAGADYLSDELFAFDPATGTARSFPRAPKIRDVCAAYFPGFTGRFVGMGEARFLPFDALPGGDELRASTRIDAVLLPRWAGAGGEPRLAPVTRGQALLELTASSLNFGTHRAQSLDFLVDVVRDARAFTLEWTDPHRAVRDVEAALGNAPVGATEA